ncbi:CheY-like chemotaxis protein [Oceanisphaera litoralis]|uniref:response regulator n=1 Tax=Oceanisphaera litoralis TaxID=225144 RepID=UPI001EF80A2E|nr:response regulator [Oceanisphaera litoralis]MBM7454807.1 CheY-like chemotaxis protein [Oceanisphaera litoralis]
MTLLPNPMFERSPLILFIEDDAVFRRLMLAYLELWGARVIEVDNGDEGLSLVAELAPDLVLIDLRLTAANGLAVIACLKQDYPALPVIAISGQKKMSNVARALRAGAEDYLVKPIRNWSLVADVITACLRPDPRRIFDELNEHLAFFRREDMAASRLCKGLRQLPERDLGAWQLSYRQNSPWVLAEYVRLDQDLLLLLAEFDPLSMDTPVVMALMTFLLHEPQRQHQSGSLLNHPGRTLEYINGLILDTGLNCRMNLALYRLQANSNKVVLANGGMAGNDWLARCDAGPLGAGIFNASQLSYPCSYPFDLTLHGGFGGEIQLTARHGVP